MAEVLEGLPYEIAVLTCDPRADASVGFSRAHGRRTVEEEVQLGDGVPRLLLARADASVVLEEDGPAQSEPTPDASGTAT
jgi:hypothetical protein